MFEVSQKERPYWFYMSDVEIVKTDFQYVGAGMAMLDIVFACKSEKKEDEQLLMLRIETKTDVVCSLPKVIHDALQRPSIHPGMLDLGTLFFHLKDEAKREHLSEDVHADAMSNMLESNKPDYTTRALIAEIKKVVDPLESAGRPDQQARDSETTSGNPVYRKTSRSREDYYRVLNSGPHGGWENMPLIPPSESTDQQPLPSNKTLLNKSTSAVDQALIALAKKWRDIAVKAGQDCALPREADILALSCLLLAVEWNEHLTESVNTVIEENMALAEKRWSIHAYSDMEKLIWKLCHRDTESESMRDVALERLTEHLTHPSSNIRTWAMELGWIARPWLPAFIVVPLMLKNVADTLGGVRLAMGLASGLCATDDHLETFIAEYEPEHYVEQYANRIKIFREEGFLLSRAALLDLECECRRIVGHEILGEQNYVMTQKDEGNNIDEDSNADDAETGAGASEKSGQQIDEEGYEKIKVRLEEIVMEMIKKQGDKSSMYELIRNIRESLGKDNPELYNKERQQIIRFLTQDYKQAVAAIKEKITPTYEAIPEDITVAARISALHCSEIPEHLMKGGGQRIGQEFDPKAYFTVLTHLSMKEECTLDYLYHIDDLGGYPCLYVRSTGDKPFKSASEYWNWKETNTLISFLVADGTPDSFFELAVFLRLAGQFYMYWHGITDTKIITSAAEMERFITDMNDQNFYSKFDISQITAAQSLETQPKVEMTYDSATVTFCFFTGRSGFTRVKERFARRFPHVLLESDVIDVVEYDRGICR